ncbi:hypothetical protein Mapa_006898 [Marchantia paleacea]|nr:hypothetical protein Mapa_006898 [Marchantia paleacea]
MPPPAPARPFTTASDIFDPDCTSVVTRYASTTGLSKLFLAHSKDFRQYKTSRDHQHEHESAVTGSYFQNTG